MDAHRRTSCHRHIRARRWALAAALGFAALPSLSPVPEASAETSARESSPVITFTGFRVYEDGSSSLFVTLTRETKVEMNQEGTKVTYLLSGAKVQLRNNKNPLIANYFGTNVLRAKLDNSKDGATLTIRLRENVRPDHNMGPVGSEVRLRVDIPPPSGQ